MIAPSEAILTEDISVEKVGAGFRVAACTGATGKPEIWISGKALKGVSVMPSHNAKISNVMLPVDCILEMLPPRYRVVPSEADSAPLPPVSIPVPNLFEQLAGGQVLIPMSTLLAHLPAEHISSAADAGNHALVSVPLQAVVTALGADAFVQRTAADGPRVSMDHLADPFDSAWIGPTAERGAAESRGAQPTAPGPSSPGGAEAPAIHILPEPDIRLAIQLPTVDLNAAEVEKLLSLPGMSLEAANALVKYRRAQGPFRDVFEVMHVPGVGRRVFRQVTGMKYSASGRHRSRVMAGLLRLPEKDYDDLSLVAAAVAELPELSGCVISGVDGQMMAQSGMAERGAALSSHLPSMLQQVRRSALKTVLPGVCSVCIHLDQKHYTIVTGGRVYLTVWHSDARLGGHRIERLLGRVQRELEWLVSPRGIVRPSASAGHKHNRVGGEADAGRTLE